ncbi:MAG: hypothetical protein ACFFKA_00120 [Candidatus Thorarchaeota archaeon]
MGLDIKSKSKIVTKKESPEAYEFNMLLDAETETMYVNPDFKSHMSEYNSEDSDDNILDYVKTEDSKEFGFSVGSYQAYNKFRNMLSNAVLGADAETVWDNADTYKDKPMYFLIDFSDCEGAMDSSVCQKLLTDFIENREKFINFIKEDNEIGDMDVQHYTEQYDNWVSALEVGADEGVLIFA